MSVNYHTMRAIRCAYQVPYWITVALELVRLFRSRRHIIASTYILLRWLNNR